jgi:two-component system response regulator AtoC
MYFFFDFEPFLRGTAFAYPLRRWNGIMEKTEDMNILIAEDDRNFGRVLKAELEESGYVVELVGDGVAAVIAFIGGRIDFVLLDVRMPRLGGIDALKIIKKLNPDVPVITFSGNAGSDELTDSVTAGAIGCLTKPFEIARIKEEIEGYRKNDN